MRIAVVHNLRPGGAKRVLFEQVKRLAGRHYIDLFTFSSSIDDYFPLIKIVNNQFEVKYTCPEHFPASILSVYFLLPRAYRVMAGQINSGNYDLAYVFPCFLTQAPYILKYLKIPSVYFCPESKREFYEKIPRVSNKLTYNLTYPFRYYLKNIDLQNIRSADKLVTLSEYNSRTVKKVYGRQSTVVPLGVDNKLFVPLKTDRENYILSVGNFSLLKGHDFIIRSLALIPEKIRPKLIIAGFGGHEKSYLHKIAGKLTVDLNVIDSPSDTKLNRLYNKAALLAFAAINEPLGLVVLEALSSGLKVIAVNSGGVPEILIKSGLAEIVERDEKKYSEAILNNVSLNEDGELKKLRRKYITNKWNWEISVKKLEELFLRMA